MAWNHDDVAPNRSRDELLDDVVRRGERIRHRRRLAGVVGGGVAVLLVVAGVAAIAGTGGEPTTQLAAGGRAATTTTLAPTTGGTVFAVDAPTTSVEATSPTTRLPIATTVPEPVTTLAPAPTVPETTVPGPKQPRCGPAVMQATLTMDAPSFVSGQPVSGQAVLRNTSGAPCYYFSYTAAREINDSLGNPVVPGAALIADAFEDTPFALGQTLSQPIQWTQSVAGSYVAKASWSFDGPEVEATAAFTVA